MNQQMSREEIETRIKELEIELKVEKSKNEVLKIANNGSYGKFGSKYSFLYSPDLLISTTLTGQLSLLMIIETLEKNGIKVVSTNTDGFVSYVPKNKKNLYDRLTKAWEGMTNFELEDTFYKALYSRDVNNYIAITQDGKKVKTKGVFAEGGIQKNPSGEISVLAVIEYLKNGTPLMDTVQNCKDVKMFLSVRNVTGGAVWNGSYLGKTVRWYYSKDGNTIHYKKNNNKVPKTDGSKPLMTLSDTFPDDVDYEKYVSESISLLEAIGEREKVVVKKERKKKEPKTETIKKRKVTK